MWSGKQRLRIALVVVLSLGFGYLLKTVLERTPDDWAKQKSNLANRLQEHAKDLVSLQKGFVSSASHLLALQIYTKNVLDMLEILNMNTTAYQQVIYSHDREAKTTAVNREVCPEQFMGKDLLYGYILFRKGFDRIPCKDFVPVEKLVTILLKMPMIQETRNKDSPDFADPNLAVLQAIAKYYPGIRVILATKETLLKSTANSISKLNIIFQSEVVGGISHSSLWEKLLKKAETRYVLLASDVTYFDDDINLERMVRVLSYEEQVAIVGGALKNEEGHWGKNCQQVTFRNWTATYTAGYYKSFNECVVCDYVSGPIMAKTRILRDVGLDESIGLGVFRDIFWRLKDKAADAIAVSCPDVMFNVKSQVVPDSEYLLFAKKHDIHRIVESDGKVRWYGCRKGIIGSSQKLCTREKGISLSPADMENLADAVKQIIAILTEAGIYYEIREGSIVGAVKFNGVLPWEVDADIMFPKTNFSAVKQLKSKFEAAGYQISEHDEGVIVITANWHIQLETLTEFDIKTVLAHGLPLTKVLFAGQWVNGPRNPGLFIRNRYGPGTYRHIQHWRELGYKTGWQMYSVGKFSKCPKSYHSACLDKFETDGNMKYKEHCV